MVNFLVEGETEYMRNYTEFIDLQVNLVKKRKVEIQRIRTKVNKSFKKKCRGIENTNLR